MITSVIIKSGSLIHAGLFLKMEKVKKKKKIPKMLEMLGVVASSRTYFLMTANISYTQLCFVPSFVKSLGSRR